MLGIGVDRTAETEKTLNLIYLERMGDLLFLFGTFLTITASYQAEQEVIVSQFTTVPVQKPSDYLGAWSGWLFLGASLIFAYTARIRFITRNGSFILMAANMIKTVGFGLAAIGNQMKWMGIR